MCYGIGCGYEKFNGECGKPRAKVCPQDLVSCENCNELFDEDDILDVLEVEESKQMKICNDCAGDEDRFKEV